MVGAEGVDKHDRGEYDLVVYRVSVYCAKQSEFSRARLKGAGKTHYDQVKSTLNTARSAIMPFVFGLLRLYPGWVSNRTAQQYDAT